MPATRHSAERLPLACNASPGDKPWQLKVTFHNRGPAPFVILRWHSPLDAWFSEFLSIEQLGQPIPYMGAKAKRGAPSEDDLLLLLPNSEHTELLDLTQAYQFHNEPALIKFSSIAVQEVQLDKPLTWLPEMQLSLECPELMFPLIDQLPTGISK